MHLEQERRVRTTTEVRSDLSAFTGIDLRIPAGEEVEISVNSLGAVSALIGEDRLGLKPSEFEYVPLPGRPLLQVMQEAVTHMSTARDHSIHDCTVLAQRMRESIGAAMTDDRARAIVAHMFDWAMFDQGVEPEAPKPMDYSLREMLDANERVAQLNKEAMNTPADASGRRSYSIQVGCDERLIAALYVAMHYPGEDGHEPVNSIASHQDSMVVVLSRKASVDTDEDENDDRSS